jgi:hypothetical protein
MNNFSLFELSVVANAIEHQCKLANDEYTQRMNYLDRISRKICQQIDVLETNKSEELSERGFYEEGTVDE